MYNFTCFKFKNMKNKNKILFATILLLSSFGLQANDISITTFNHNLTLNAPQADGVIHIVQGRSAIRVEIKTILPVKLTVLDKEQNKLIDMPVIQNNRYVYINTENYTSGIYTLIADSPIDSQVFNFIVIH